MRQVTGARSDWVHVPNRLIRAPADRVEDASDLRRVKRAVNEGDEAGEGDEGEQEGHPNREGGGDLVAATVRLAASQNRMRTERPPRPW